MNKKEEIVNSIIDSKIGGLQFTTGKPAPMETQKEVYKAFFDGYLKELAPQLQAAFLEKRGLSEKDLKTYGIHSINLAKPLSELMKQFGGAFDGIPGFYRNGAMLETTLPQDDPAAFLCEVKDSYGNVVGGHIRLTRNPKTKEKKAVYTYLTSPDKGLPATTQVHFVGYLEETLIVTEGALKANIINKFTGRYTAGLLDGGGYGTLLRELKQMNQEGRGVKRILFAFDHNDDNMVKNGFKLLEELGRLGFSYQQIVWDERYKGLDDFLFSLKKANRLEEWKSNILESYYLHR